MLDTGRALSPDQTLVPASYGGPKLVCVDISTNEVVQIIVFPPDVALPESYLNDIRFDLRSQLTESGKGIAYISDSSSEGKNGIVVVDLGSEESWRVLDTASQVHPEPGFVPFIWGTAVYSLPGPTHVNFGVDGIALAADGESLYFGSVGGRKLYRVPTSVLRDRSDGAEERAVAAVESLGERGVSDGFETDSTGKVYMGNMEQNGVGVFDPQTGLMDVFVRNRRISWVDTREFCFTDGASLN